MGAYGSLAQFMSENPESTGIGRNALRDLAQLGSAAPLMMHPALATVASSGLVPQPQDYLRTARGLGDFVRLAVSDPQKLQALATSFLSSSPSLVTQTFKEHPVAAPLMAIPILPGGAKFGADDARFWAKWGNEWDRLHAEGLKSGLNPHDAMKWASKQLELALRRLTSREKNVQRRLGAHAAEDVIQESLSQPQLPQNISLTDPNKMNLEGLPDQLHTLHEGPVGPLPPITDVSYGQFTKEQLIQRYQEMLRFEQASGKPISAKADLEQALRRFGVKPENLGNAAEGGRLLESAGLKEQPPTWQQGVVQKLTGWNATAPASWKEHWENGQRFVRGPKGWTMDPHMFIPPIQRIGGETILPRPEGAVGKYLDRTIWPQLVDGKGQDLNEALLHLQSVTGDPKIAHFWLARHIFTRIIEKRATPAEVVWFNLQKGFTPPDEGMAGAAR